MDTQKRLDEVTGAFVRRRSMHQVKRFVRRDQSGRFATALERLGDEQRLS